jgi:RNA polymerase sigma factor (sigma-70 family)
VRRILGFKALRVPAHELEDLEQDVMTQVWRAVNRPGFDPEAGIWGFVEVVTSRRCIDWLRTRRTAGELDDSVQDARQGPLAETLAEESRRLASEAMASLDEGCRELIALRIGQELSFKELSSRLGKTEEALRVQMYRCVQGARKLLARRAAGPRIGVEPSS